MAADLSSYGKTHSPNEIRQHILNHNKEGRHDWARVVTRSGGAYEGFMRNEDNFSLQLQTPSGDFLFFEKASLVTVKHQPPWTEAAKLNEKDLDNLINYLSQR
jgi:hypothetical protein